MLLECSYLRNNYKKSQFINIAFIQWLQVSAMLTTGISLTKRTRQKIKWGFAVL